MTTYTIARDINGNKTVKVSVPGFRAYSIQTNGNLPRTHRSGIVDDTQTEVARYVSQFGTRTQKTALGLA